MKMMKKILKFMLLHSSHNENNEDGELMPIETDEEWDLIEEMLNTFLDEQEEEEE